MRASARHHPGNGRLRLRCWDGARAGGRAWLLALLLGLLGASWTTSAEDRISVSHATVTVRSGADPGTFVDAQFDLELPSSLREAVDHGIALYFVIELEVSRSRWYWFDKRLLDDAIEYRLSFSPLTRQYRLARGGLAQPFDSLDQALATMRRVTQWRVGDASLFTGSSTHGQIRMRLDTSMLPKPFQVSALTDPDWKLESDWSRLLRTKDDTN
ncbi:MAG TPA: DUF4390 domain-containing protein [Burkholderiaceae bacterium]|nr:DUF4390 domain-containing protein [Burkholderiaceae bacterium]